MTEPGSSNAVCTVVALEPNRDMPSNMTVFAEELSGKVNSSRDGFVSHPLYCQDQIGSTKQ
jgi:hypothetical protein